jgi:hypothetical protein
MTQRAFKLTTGQSGAGAAALQGVDLRRKPSPEPATNEECRTSLEAAG